MRWYAVTDKDLQRSDSVPDGDFEHSARLPSACEYVTMQKPDSAELKSKRMCTQVRQVSKDDLTE